MGTTYGAYSAYVPEYTDCAVIFYIDKAGTMLRYDMKTTGKISYNACGNTSAGSGSDTLLAPCGQCRTPRRADL